MPDTIKDISSQCINTLNYEFVLKITYFSLYLETTEAHEEILNKNKEDTRTIALSI